MPEGTRTAGIAHRASPGRSFGGWFSNDERIRAAAEQIDHFLVKFGWQTYFYTTFETDISSAVGWGVIMTSRTQPEIVDEKDAVDRIAHELGIELPPVELPDEQDGTWESWETDDLDTLLGTSGDDGLEGL
jgi:hypothetical protein